jgi:hypothetical protein
MAAVDPAHDDLQRESIDVSLDSKTPLSDLAVQRLRYMEAQVP